MYNPSSRLSHNVVAPRLFTNIEYGFAGQVNSLAGAAFAIYGNSIYKPGATSAPFAGTLYPATVAITALKAVGVDSLNSLYARYRVYQSTITVTVIPASQSSSAAQLSNSCQLVILPNTAESTLADIQLAQSLPYSKYQINCIGGSGKENTLVHTMDTRTICGISDEQMRADPAYTALNTTVPASPWWWTIVIASFDNSTSNKNFNVSVRCNYRVEFFDPVCEPDVQ